jgi:hypothetical protein
MRKKRINSMDYANYDAMQNDSEEDYWAFITWLEDKTANSLNAARGNIEAIKQAIVDYLEKGYSAHLSSGELVDFFCVSTPSILDKAGYSEEEADAAVRLYDEINPELFHKYYPENRKFESNQGASGQGWILAPEPAPPLTNSKKDFAACDNDDSRR